MSQVATAIGRTGTSSPSRSSGLGMSRHSSAPWFDEEQLPPYLGSSGLYQTRQAAEGASARSAVVIDVAF
jgi:hypothetical protein